MLFEFCFSEIETTNKCHFKQNMLNDKFFMKTSYMVKLT